MLLWQFNCVLFHDFFAVSLKSGEDRTITINDDEAEGRLNDQKFLLDLVELKLGPAVIGGEVDWLVWFKVIDKLPLRGGVFIDDFSGEDDEAVIRRAIVKFESFPGRTERLND